MIFEDVGFSYEEGKQVLFDVGFHSAPGRIVRVLASMGDLILRAIAPTVARSFAGPLCGGVISERFFPGAEAGVGAAVGGGVAGVAGAAGVAALLAVVPASAAAGSATGPFMSSRFKAGKQSWRQI